MKISLVLNKSRDENYEKTIKIAKKLEEFGVEILAEEKLTEKMKKVKKNELFEKGDIVITLGGDGTLLDCSKLCAENNVPVLGINLGRLGFLAELEKNDLESLEKIVNGSYKTEKRMMLNARVFRNGKEVFSSTALNDVVISRGGQMKLIHLTLEIDNKKTDEYYSDGLILATPTGSTAYSLSAGGPILTPSLDAMVITPVCPHTITSRPMVISGSQEVSVIFNRYHEEEVLISCDGVDEFILNDGDVAKITKSEKKLTLIRCENRDFFDVLNQKLAERR